jgi:hypothetical protein
VIDALFSHAEIVPEAVARPVNVGGFTRYALVDRGSYEVAAFHDDALVLELCDIAARRLGAERATATEARVIRLLAGDYILARHDLTQIALLDPSLYGAHPFERRRVELVLDLSPAPVDAEIHYRRRGQVFFRVPCAPRSLAIIERAPAVTCNHTYLSKRTPNAVVTRLIVLLDLLR